MSNYLAVATVTEVLARRLGTALGARVLCRRPADNEALPDEPIAYLYLYRVTPNSGWANRDLPALSADGRRALQRPVAALNLHYLLCFYGSADTLMPQRLLGLAVTELHRQPVLTREQIGAAVEQTRYLADSNLADAVELVKLTPETLGLEELARLWALFPQASQALALTYEATVVLIEPDEAPRSPLPVLERTVTALPFRRPSIEEIALRTASIDGAPHEALVIKGQQLRGETTLVRFDGAQLETPRPALVGGQHILLVYAELARPLRAGVHGVQVVHQALIGVERRTIAESPVAPFVIFPTIDDRPGDPAVAAQRIVEDAYSGLLSTTITIQRIAPPVEAGQRLVLQLNEYALDPPSGRAAYAYSFATTMAQDAASTNTVSIAVAGVRPATYLVRLQVDGAESRLAFDTDPLEPARPGRATPARFVGPRVRLEVP